MQLSPPVALMTDGRATGKKKREGSDEFAGKWLCAHNASVRRTGGKRALFFTDVNPEPENKKRRKGYDEKKGRRMKKTCLRRCLRLRSLPACLAQK